MAVFRRFLRLFYGAIFALCVAFGTNNAFSLDVVPMCRDTDPTASSCGAGYYKTSCAQLTGGGTIQGCVICPAGTYQPNSSATSCTSCSSNATSSAGATYCTCKTGYSGGGGTSNRSGSNCTASSTCSLNEINFNGTCKTAYFSVKTTSSTTSISFEFGGAAQGTFYVDCGLGGTPSYSEANSLQYLSTTVSGTVAKVYIKGINCTSSSGNYSCSGKQTVTCSYSLAGEHIIRFSGDVEDYLAISASMVDNTETSDSNYNRCPKWNVFRIASGSGEKVQSVSGSLGKIFKTLTNGNKQPIFRETFSGTKNMTSIPANVFDGVSGEPGICMFAYTFSGSGIQNIPTGLFSGLHGTSAGLFHGTFYGNEGLTEIQPALFETIAGEQQSYMYYNTFNGAKYLKYIPKDLFGNIYGTPSYGLFYDTFRGAGLSGDGLHGLPETLFNRLSGVPAKMAFKNMFALAKYDASDYYVSESLITNFADTGYDIGSSTSAFHSFTAPEYVNGVKVTPVLSESCPANMRKLTYQDKLFIKHISGAVCGRCYNNTLSGCENATICSPGQYANSTTCSNCPSTFPNSDIGAVSINDCYATVTFMQNNCNPPVVVKYQYESDGNYAVRLIDVSKANDEFVGWYKTANFSGNAVTNSSNQSGNLVLYAKWANTNTACNSKYYKVRLNHNGGTGTKNILYALSNGNMYDSNVNLVQGNSSGNISSTTPPTLSGYTFAGYYDANYQTEQWISSSGSINVSSVANYIANHYTNTDEVTLIAKWTQNAPSTYTVTLNKNASDATAGTTSVTATYGSAMPTPITLPTRTGYKFNGYFTATSGGTQYYDKNGASVKNYDNTSVTTLYAQWTVNTFYVKYYGYGNTGGTTPANQTCTYGGNCTAAPANTYTKTGYTFDGWICVLDINDGLCEEKQIYSAGESIATAAGSQYRTDTITLTAKWVKNTYDITYMDGGMTLTGLTPTTTYTVGTGATINATPSKAHGSFDKWCLDAGLTNCATTQTISTTAIGDKTYHSKFTCDTGYTFNPGSAVDLVDIIGTGAAESQASIDANYNANYKEYTNHDPSFYGLTAGDNNSFAVNYGDRGIIRGHAACSTTSGTVNFNGTNSTFSTQSSINDRPYDTDAGHCWCHIDGYTADGENWQKVSSSWVLTNNFDQNHYCAGDCSFICAYRLMADDNDNLAYRAALLGSVDRGFPGTASTCAANTYTVKYACGTGATGNPPTNGTATYNANFTPDANNTCAKTGYTFAGWNDGTSDRPAGTAFKWTYTSGKTFTAKWTLASSNLTFNLNGGTGTAPTAGPATAGQSMPTLSSTTKPTKTGYAFGGWWDDPDVGDGTQYYRRDGSSARTWNKTAANVTLYARWVPVYTITLNANGGSPTQYMYAVSEDYEYDGISFGVYFDAAATVNASNKLITDYKDRQGNSILAVPTRTGYTFDGYYNTQSGGHQVISETGYTSVDGDDIDYLAGESSGNFTIYARWIAKASNLTFNLNGGDGTAPTVSDPAIYGQSMPTLSSTTKPTRSGYAFGGWYDTSAATGGTAYYTRKGSPVRTWNKTDANVTLYARWVPVYTVTLYARGGSPTPQYMYAVSSGNADYGSDLTSGIYCDDAATIEAWDDYNITTSQCGKSVPDYTGYTFNGYFDAQTGGNLMITRNGYIGYDSEDDDTGELDDEASDSTRSFPIYAQWTPNTYTVTLDDATNGGSGGMGTIKEIYGNKWTDANGNTITSVTIPTSASGLFQGYYDSNNVQKISANGALTNKTLITANATWYAKFSNCVCTTATGVASCESIASDDPNRCKYTYTCREYYNTNGAQSGTFYGNTNSQSSTSPSCDPNGYAITLDNANATTNGTATIYTTYNTNVYLDSARTTIVNSSNPIIIPQRSDYITVSYNANGGSIKNALTDDNTKSTYEFDGYYSDVTGGTQYISGAGYMTTDGRNAGKLYTTNNNVWHAQWQPQYVYPPVVNTRDGYNFLGWYETQNGGNCVARCTSGSTYIGPSRYTPSAAITLYAHWEPLVYKVTLQDNGANTSSNVSEFWYRYNESNNPCTYYAADASVAENRTSANCLSTPITLPTRLGYTFNGYNFSTSGNGTQYIDSSGNILDAVYTTNGNITAYANWTANRYTVETDLNDGNSSITSSNATYNSSFTKSGPTRDGYTFAGWNITGMDDTEHTIGSSTTNATSLSGITAKTFKNLRATSGTVRFTAQWTPNTYTITYKTSYNGEVINGLNPTSYTTGSTINLPTNVNVADHVFSGYWYDDNGNTINKITSDMYGDKELYAKWTRITCPPGYYVRAENTTNGNDCEECYGGGYYCPGGPITITNIDQGKIDCPTTTNAQEGAYSITGYATLPWLSGDIELSDTEGDCAAGFVYGKQSVIETSNFGYSISADQNYDSSLPANTRNAMSTTSCAYDSTTHAYTNCLPLLPGAALGFYDIVLCANGYYIPQSDIDFETQIASQINQCDGDSTCTTNVINTIKSHMGAPYVCTEGDAGYYTATYDAVINNENMEEEEREFYSNNIGAISVYGNLTDLETGDVTTDVSDTYKSCSVETNGAYTHSQRAAWMKKQCYATISFNTYGGNTIADRNYYYNDGGNMGTCLSAIIDETDAEMVMFKSKRLNGTYCYAGDNGNTAISEDCNNALFDDLSNGDWAVEWTYGTINGKSWCSTTSAASAGTVGNPNTTASGNNCWCKVESFVDNNSNVSTSASDTWVFSNTMSECTNNCAISCAGGVIANPKMHAAEFDDACVSDEFPIPVRDGFTFAGWYTSLAYTGNPLNTSADLSGGDQTLYAKWTSNTYTVTLDDVTNGGSGGMGTIKEIYNSRWTDANGNTITSVTIPTSTSGLFQGYYDSNNVQKIQADGLLRSTVSTTADTTWYAKFSNCRCLHDVSVASCESIVSDDPNRCKYTYTCVEYYNTNGEQSGTFYGNTNSQVSTSPSCNPNTYTITYNLDGGSGCDNTTYSGTTTLCEPNRTGYSFGGWATSADGGVVYASGSSVTNVDLTLYAKWSQNTYTITYNLDDGTNNANNPSSYNVNSETITLADPTKTGYTFDGWFAESTFDTRITEITHGSTGNKELYAKWTLLTGICSSTEIEYLGTCYPRKFWMDIVIPDDDKQFQFMIAAAGTFYVDCGADGTLTSNADPTDVDNLHGTRIYRPDYPNKRIYTCTYTTAGTKTINFAGEAEGYGNGTETSISFNTMNFTSVGYTDSQLLQQDTNVKKINKIYGSLGSIFKTITNLSNNNWEAQPMFMETFAGGSEIEETIPANIFSGVTGTRIYMFESTFDGCSKLTGGVPDFSNISGAGQNRMFYRTFNGCSGLNGTIPSDAFLGINSAATEMFSGTFHNCSGLTGKVPSFKNIIGGADSMFAGTFYGCSGLNSTIPSDAFSGINSAAASMFAYTFSGCSGLTGNVPSFKNIVGGTGANNMFIATFFSCSGLNGTIPSDVFSGITGTARGMFAGTFYGCSNLNQMPDNNGVVHNYVDGSFLNNVYTAGTNYSTNNIMTDMFNDSGFDNPCPAGTYQVKSEFGSAASKPWCSPCPNNYTSVSGSNDTINQCYTTCPVTDTNNQGTYLSGNAYYVGEGVADDVSQCKYTYTITYNLDDGTNNANNPSSYNVNSETITLADPTKTGYAFDGWFAESTFDTRITEITHGSTGNKELYAKWTLLTGICSSTEIEYLGTCYPRKFWLDVVIPDDDKTFGFSIAAAGTFYVDCGADGTLTSNANPTDVDNLYGTRIYRPDYPNKRIYTCTYTTAGTKTINFAGEAEGYGNGSETSISFNKVNYTYSGYTGTQLLQDTNVKKINKIYGSLGSIFKTVSNLSNNNWKSQPGFGETFAGGSEIEGTIPTNIFSGVTGTRTMMFESTFEGCSKLTGGIPDFSNIHGEGKPSMFSGTFRNCSGLTGPISPDAFLGITSAASSMFAVTFYGCSGLTGSVPSFKNIVGGTGADNMFRHTFYNCSGLNGTIPSDAFEGINGTAQSMFDNTFAGCSKLTGRIPYFSNINGAGQSRMFFRTFQGCSGLSGPISPDAFLGINSAATEMFSGTFYGCSGLTGNAPSFKNIVGGADSMFRQTFSGCSGLSGVPSDAFSGINSAASGMFSGTFQNCSGLTGNVPSFKNIVGGTGADNMFANTFYNCSGLNGTIPLNTFSGITSTAEGMFASTFYGCSNLKMPDANGVNHNYIDASFLNNIYTAGTNYRTNNIMYNMFLNSGFDNPCPAGTYQVKPEFGRAASKPWCDPCPNNYTSVSGSNDTINQCYTECPATDSLGGTYVSEPGGHAYYDVNGDDISTCTYGYAITYNNMDGATNNNAPASYVFGIGATIDSVPTRDGYFFIGWCTDEQLQNCASSHTISASDTGNKTFYAKWTPVKFTVVTRPMVANDTFKFNMTAYGTFYVDCGDDGVLTSTANDVVGKVITRGNTTNATYTCTYGNAANSHTIKFGGLAERYSTASWTDGSYIDTPAIRFGTGVNDSTSDSTPAKIASITGSLGAIFPTKNNGSAGYADQPRFGRTFDGATYLTALPVDTNNKSTLFSGISGAGVDEMFYRTFSNTGLTLLPSGLFDDITGATALFDKTFKNCSALTTLPGDLFADLNGAYSAMFLQTFDSAGLTSIPDTLFDSISGNADRLFSSTFSGCRSLKTLPSDTNGASLLFKHVTGSNTAMYHATFSGTSLLSLPTHLFPGISNASANTTQVANRMFAYTFSGTALSSLPSGLFAGLSGSANEAFNYTFASMRNLSTIRSDLFAGLSGGATSMFANTFDGSSVWHVYNTNTNETLNYIPGFFLDNITTSATGLVTDMFASTAFKSNCPEGTYKNQKSQTNGIFSAAGRPWCDPCPNNYTSVSGSNDTINQCYTACPATDSLGGTYVSELGGHAYYDVNGDDISTCTYGYQIQYVLCPDSSSDCVANASNDDQNPSTYNTTQDVTLYDASRIGYDFAGWYDNVELTGNIITSIPQNSIGSKTFYASWVPETYEITYRCDDNGDIVHTDSLIYADPYTFVSNTGNSMICSRTGWIFTGWTCSYVDANLETHYVPTDSVENWHVTYDVSCVPSPWEEIQFNVSFNPNSMYVTNADAVGSMSCPYSTGCAMPESTYVRKGYMFNGWKSNENETYNVGDTVKEKLSDITMYAQWKLQDNIACEPGTYLKAGDYDKCTNCPVGFYCTGFAAGDYVYNATTDQGIRACRADFGSYAMVTTDSQCPGSDKIGGCAPSRDYCYVPCDATYGNYVIDSEHSKIRYGQTARDVCWYKADIEYEGSENCDVQTYHIAERNAVPLCVPTAVEGRTFIGWIDNKGNEYNDIRIDNNERKINDNVPESGVVTMHANWDIEQYAISYDCDNGNNIIVGGMEYNDDVELLDYARCNNPGHTLTAWNCGDNFVDNNKMPNHDVGCVAQTTVNTYNIVFDGNGAESGNVDAVENLQYTAETQLPENHYARSGYNFVGWCNTATCSDQVYTDKGTVSRLTPDNNATVVLYAKWEAIPYSISYTIPYGKTVANRTTYTKETPTFTLNNPSVAGYKFNAWCTNAELTENCETTKTIEQGSSFGDLHFFADIELIEYNIVYKFKDVDGVVHDISDMFAERYTKRTIGQSVAYPNKADVNIPNYRFIAWYSNSSLSGATTTGVAGSVANNMTVWAKVKPLTCEANQYIQDGVCIDCPVNSSSNGGLATECVCNEGYNDNGESCVANTIILDWNENGGTLIDNGSCEYGSDFTLPDAPVRNGYTFVNWKLADGTTKSSGDIVNNGCVVTYTGATSNTSTDITAQWNIQRYTIKYHSNGGTTYPQKQYTVNSADIILPQNAVRNGYTFAGWYDNEALSGSAVDMVAQGSTGNKEFWAKWNIKNYEISYNKNGGEYVSGYTPVATYNINSGTVLLPTSDNITRANYVFAGWVDNNNKVVTEIPAGASGNKELTAQWTREPCERNQYLNTTTDSCEACPAHSTSAGGLVAQCNCDNHYAMNSNICVPKSYTITYYMDGGSLDTGLTNPQTYNIETPETTLYVPTKTDYTFNGWRLNSTSGATVTSISGAMANYKNIKLYVKWIKNPDIRTITYNCTDDKTIERTGFVESNVNVPTTEECEITVGSITGWTCNGQTYTGTMAIQSSDITCTPVISYADVEYDVFYKGYDTDGNEIDLSFLGSAKYTASNGIRLPTKSQINVPGYNFERWYLRYNNSVFSSSTNGYAPNANIRGAKTFYAKFTLVTTHCDPGYYLMANSTECAQCAGDGVYCPGGTIAYSNTPNIIMSCDEDYPLSDVGAKSADDCYKLCEEREHYTVAGRKYSNGINTCVYTPVAYHVYYNTDGGNTIEPTGYNVRMATIARLPIPEHDGFQFTEWQDENGNRVDSVDTSIARDITLYAQYLCDENNIEYTDNNENKHCIPAKFTVTTVDDGGTFSTWISAFGEFYIDCGTGGNFNNTGKQVGVIDKQNTDMYEYNCIWESGTEHTIKYAGIAEQYSMTQNVPTIHFGRDYGSNPKKIVSISGSLSAIFPTLNDGSNDPSQQPQFSQTFKGCTRLTSLPIDENGNSTLFTDVFGATDYMFESTFSGCSGLTSLPEDLFKGVSGAASYMFYNTFEGCSGLKSIPEHLFVNANGQGVSGSAGSMFFGTFSGCSGLTKVPVNLFSNLTGSVSPYLFGSTFDGCINLKKFSPAVLTDSDEPDYIPYGFLSTNLTNTNNIDVTTSMFNNTQIAISCPTNMYTNYMPDWLNRENLQNKVMCDGCGDVYPHSVKGSNDTHESCYAIVTYHNGDETETQNINYKESAADNYGLAELTLPNLTKDGYKFIGWFTANGTEVTEESEFVGDVDLYAHWITCAAGQYLDGNNVCQSCPLSHPKSVALATSIDQCYRTCNKLDVPNAKSVTGHVYKDGTRTCEPTSCKTGYDVTPGADVSTTALLGSANTLATCEAHTYTITYNLDGGTYDDALETYTVATDTITLGTPTKTAYNFAGWYDNPEFNGNPVTQIAKGSTGNKALWAKWEFECQSGKWLHIGNGDDKICMYAEKPAGAVLVFGTRGSPMYIMLTKDKNVPIHNGSSKKLRVAIGNKVYNAHDASVNVD